MGKTSKLDARKEELEKLLNEGVHIKDIAKTFRINATTIYKYIRKFYVKTKRKPYKIKPKLSEKDKLIIKLLNAGVTTKSIAETLGIRRRTLYKYIRNIRQGSCQERIIKQHEQRKEQIKKFLAAKKSIVYISKTLNIALSTTYRYINKFNLNYEKTIRKINTSRQDKMKQRVKELLDTGANRKQIGKILKMSTSNAGYYIRLIKHKNKKTIKH